MDRTASPAPPAAQPSAGPPIAMAGLDICRLTVIGPAKRADLSVPVTVTVSELLPMLLQQTVAEDDREQPWVLQRLGGEPFDPDATAETLELRHGEVLYLRPRQHALPTSEFDDVAAGVAQLVSERADRWRPAFTTGLLTVVAGLVLGAFTLDAIGLRLGVWIGACFGAATVVLGVACLLATRLAGDRAGSLVAGVSACVFAAAAGMAGVRGLSGIVAPGRDELLLGGVCAGMVAATLLACGARPITPYGSVLAVAVATSTSAGIALVSHWPAAWAAATLAVAMFVFSARGLRVVLRAARLRAPELPGTAEELLQDIDPEPEARLAERAANAIAYLNCLTIGGSILFAASFALLARSSQWAELTLAAVFSGAVLLRARPMVGLWQRVPLAIAGTFGLVAVVERLASAGGTMPRVVSLAVLLAVGLLLLAAARWLPGRRLLPVWGQLAGQLETVTAITLVPLLLFVLHVYSHVRSLIG